MAVASAPSARFTPDGRTIVTDDATGALGFWDARTRARLGRPLKVSDEAVWPPQFSADGRWLAVTGQDAVVRLFDAHRRTEVRKVHMDQLPRDIAMRPDGKVLAVPATWGPGEGYVDILSVPSLTRITRIAMPYGRWSHFSRDGRLLILGDHEGRAEIYDGHTFTPRGRPLLGHAGFILTADFSPDSRTVATSSSDGTIRLWDTTTSRPIGARSPGSRTCRWAPRSPAAAPTSRPSTTTARDTPGTCGPRRGGDGHAQSRGARSPGRNGTRCCRDATLRRRVTRHTDDDRHIADAPGPAARRVERAQSRPPPIPTSSVACAPRKQRSAAQLPARDRARCRLGRDAEVTQVRSRGRVGMRPTTTVACQQSRTSAALHGPKHSRRPRHGCSLQAIAKAEA